MRSSVCLRTELIAAVRTYVAAEKQRRDKSLLTALPDHVLYEKVVQRTFNGGEGVRTKTLPPPPQEWSQEGVGAREARVPFSLLPRYFPMARTRSDPLFPSSVLFTEVTTDAAVTLEGPPRSTGGEHGGAQPLAPTAAAPTWTGPRLLVVDFPSGKRNPRAVLNAVAPYFSPAYIKLLSGNRNL